MDFIIGLHLVDGYSSIMVVVDRFSKYRVFISASTTCHAEDVAWLFFTYVVKYWGIPRSIIFDRDAHFTGKFWIELFRILGKELKMSTAFHPKTDSQIE